MHLLRAASRDSCSSTLLFRNFIYRRSKIDPVSGAITKQGTHIYVSISIFEKKRKKKETGGNVAARSVIAEQPWEKNAELRFDGIACRCGGQYRKTKNTKIDSFVRTLSLILKRLLQGEVKHRMIQNCTQ